MDPDLVLDPTQGSEPAALADWAELRLFISDADVLTREEIKRTLEDEPDSEVERWAEDDRAGAELEVEGLEGLVSDDARTDRLLREIRRRRATALRIYGHLVEDGAIVTVDVSGGTIYTLLLWLSLSGTPFRVDGRDDEVEQPFDEVSLAALKVLAGPRAEGVLFARRYAEDPSTSDRRPTSFPAAIAWLRGRLKLPAGLDRVPDRQPDDDEADHPARTYSDGGVDVVVWRHFKDGRAGFPILLAQCTIQTDWRPKATDIVLDLWEDWIRFVTRPHKALVIPFAVPEGRSWWRDRNRTAGMVVDRMRLCELLDAAGDEELSALAAASLGAWLARERRELIARRTA